MKNIIDTQSAPQPIGPYSQAVRFENFIFTSGQIPIDPVTNEICSDEISAQTRCVLRNLQAVLEAGGASLKGVLKTTIFLKDMKNFPVVNQIYGEYFDSDTAPARSTVEVSRLPKDVLIEIEAVAFRSKSSEG